MGGLGLGSRLTYWGHFGRVVGATSMWMLTKHNSVLVVAFCLAIVGGSLAQSQRRLPQRIPPPSQSTEAGQQSQADKRGTEETPFIVKVLESEQKTSADQRREAEKASNDASLALFTERVVWATVALSVIGFFQLIVFGWQGFQLYCTVNSFLGSERAFVKMSHPAPGIAREPSTGRFRFKIGIKNFGRTPATISDVLLNRLVLPKGSALPGKPPYERQDGPIPKAFLVAGEEMFYERNYQITPAEMIAVKDHHYDLYLIGYVDYIDQFGKRHRSGYARVYQPTIDDRGSYGTDAEFDARNNLVFVTHGGYNYDRPRKKGEGNDWNEAARS